MNKVLLWSIIGIVFIVLLYAILAPNIMGALSKSASDNTIDEKWMNSNGPKATSGGEMPYAECPAESVQYEMDETPRGTFVTSPKEYANESEPMYDADKQNDVSESETPDDKEPLQTNKKYKRQMIYTADYRIHVKDFEVGISTAKSLLADYQGYVNLQTNSRLVVRVPAEYFDDFTKALERIGKVISRNIRAVEVTTQYYDLKRRIEVLEASIKAWEKKRLLVKTDEAIIKIDQIIDNKVSELEVYKGKLRVLSDQISRSTITIDFTMDPTPEPALPRHKYHVPYNWIRNLNPERLLPDYSYTDEE
ncbi:MAG: DUF4349 domain-containing protein [Planctomycetes bacterium]|nr:DUF4349 domain-containing protein [Planctomycetota bacterium]